MAKKNIVEQFNETKENLRPDAPKFRSGNVFEEGLHAKTFHVLLMDADKKTTLDFIEGIANDVFAKDEKQRSVECNILKDIIRDNIHDEDVVSKSFGAMKKMLNSATVAAKSENKEIAIAKVNTMQNMIDTISELYDYYPNKLGKQTDLIYEEYKKMMKEYSLRGLYRAADTHNNPKIDDYFFDRDAYQIAKEVDVINRQTDAAWETKEQINAAKQRVYNKFTKKEIADYEVSHTEQVKREDAQYRADLKYFVKGHENRERSKDHQKQINEIKLKNNDKLLEAAYENFKDIARKPKEDDKSEKPASNNVPKRAVYVGRGKPRQ